MTLVEEIARAICEAQTQEDRLWQAFGPEAQAALSVILQRLREPDEGMGGAMGLVFCKPEHASKFVDCVLCEDILRAVADHLEGKESA
jgi:hypothetical protein